MQVVVTKGGRQGTTLYAVEYEIRDDSNNLLAFNYVIANRKAGETIADILTFLYHWLEERCAVWAAATVQERANLSEARIGERLPATGWTVQAASYSRTFTLSDAEAFLSTVIWV